VIGCSALQARRFGADDGGMDTKGTVCDTCGRPVDTVTIVVLFTRDGHKLVRHRRCHLLELLERA
jgi:hypothetical protein